MSSTRWTVAALTLTMAAVACAPRHARQREVPGHFAGSEEYAARRRHDDLAAQVAAEPGAVRTQSGLVYADLERGSGATPRPSDSVSIRYQVKTADGKVVEDSATYGGIVILVLDRTSPCVREAVQRMRVGGKSRFVCPFESDGAANRRAPTLISAMEVVLVNVGQEPLPLGH